MHIFTSVTSNYIPKARVLAYSVKKFHPEAQFHLLLSDDVPEWLGEPGEEPFDSVIHIEELPIPDIKAWIFKHSLVELCTAVKGFGFQEIIKRFTADKVIYFDPDIVVLSRLDSLLAELDKKSILLTPHQVEPEKSHESIIDNEICSLKHGVFNIGFLAIRSSSEGKRFVDWWAQRLEQFCYDDIPAGLFTDQRWVDLAPCFFDDIKVLRDPQYNVATWNLTNRVVDGSFEHGFTSNGQPLCFYHFSGFDSGAQEVMLDKYGSKSPILKTLREWYIDECREKGQENHGSTPCAYEFFDNKNKISRQQRLLYRSRKDLMAFFKNPYDTSDTEKSYSDWYTKKYPEETSLPSDINIEDAAALRNALIDARNELSEIRHSRSWRLALFIAKLFRPFKKCC